MQTHNTTDDAKKGLQTQAFQRAADGIQTHDLLHGQAEPEATAIGLICLQMRAFVAEWGG
jgi:hypothetical protein